MARSQNDVLAAMHHVAGHSDHQAKKTALFDTIHRMIEQDIAESERLGATRTELEPFIETANHFEALRPQIVSLDLT